MPDTPETLTVALTAESLCELAGVDDGVGGAVSSMRAWRLPGGGICIESVVPGDGTDTISIGTTDSGDG